MNESTIEKSTLPPLLTTCLRCTGCGVVQGKAWARFEAEHPDPESWRKAIDAGEHPNEPEDTDCPQCHGHGEVPTDAGHQIARLLNVLKKN